MNTSRQFLRGRRLLAAALASGLLATGMPPAAAESPRPSRALSLASAEEVERSAIEQYEQLKRQAAAQGALAPPDYPPLQRVQRIAERMIPHVARFNQRAPSWPWEVNLIGSKQVNAFCMPGGKIAVFTGLLDRLRLTDDEVAVVVGHEMAHALLEHGRERVGKARAAQWVTMGASVFSQILGYGNLGGAVADTGSQLLLLKYGREDELEADSIGLELAARAGYDPRAALVLWKKMDAVARQGGQTPPQWLSTHPSNSTRTRDIEARLPAVLPLYAQAIGADPGALPAYETRALQTPRGSGPRGMAAAPATPAATDGAGETGAVPRGAGPRGTPQW